MTGRLDNVRPRPLSFNVLFVCQEIEPLNSKQSDAAQHEPQTTCYVTR